MSAELFERVPIVDGANYCPALMIECANQCLNENKELLFRSLIKYSESLSTEEQRKIFVFLRVIFELPNDEPYFPAAPIGQPSFGLPEKPELFPRFPILVMSDIPFLLSHSYTLIGYPARAEPEIKRFFKNYELRQRCFEPFVEDSLRQRLDTHIEKYVRSVRKQRVMLMLDDQLSRMKSNE